MKKTFSARAFQKVAPLMRAIYDHPFNRELISGSLSRKRFLYYMGQDSLYLIAFARALALSAGKLERPEDAALALFFAEQGLLAERELHAFYFKEYQATPAKSEAPACFAYRSHLLERAGLGSPAESMAALLPCFWIYREVGAYVRSRAQADNPYARWIENYAGDDYSKIVDQAVDLTDRLAAEAGVLERKRMLDAFVISARYEYSFWDDAYALRSWPL
ncbi:MAG: TenA family protein [Desulfovibrio sp.]|jgi:thiaminase/transcriptional activator TenA|nr:TenA family protein [Desulfovibrio sp.]